MNTLPSGPIYQLSPWRHPFRFAGLSIRRFVIRELRRFHIRDDNNATSPLDGDFDGGEIPHELQHFQRGELVPFKGLMFRVGKVVGGPMPAVILVPVGLTRGTKLRTMRQFRDRARAQKRA